MKDCSSSSGRSRFSCAAAALSLGTLVAMSATVWNGAASAEEIYKATAAITLPNGQNITSFDIGYVDPSTGLYILADRTNKSVAVVETSSNKVVAQLGRFVGNTGNSDTSGPDGVLIVNHREIWAGDGNSKVKVIDLFTHKTTHVIDTGGSFRADELCYDARDKVIVVANDAEHDNPSKWPFVTIISAESYTPLARITMDGFNGRPKATNGIEQCQWSSKTGMVYVNIPEVNGPGNDTRPGAVVVINPKTMKIANTFRIPLRDCAGPQGMALGPDTQAVLGCNMKSSAIIDLKSGDVIVALPHESGADEADYDPSSNHYFIAERGNANGPSLGVIDAGLPDPKVEDPTASTGAGSGAHSVAVDPVTGQVYVPISNAATGGVCSSAGGIDSQGCIAVYTATGGNDGAVAQR